MKLAVIGRTQVLYITVLKALDAGHVIKAVVTARAAPEYTAKEKDFMKLCRLRKIPCFVTSRLDARGLRRLFDDCDIGISMNWVSLMGQKEINRFRLGILNAHCGDLPRYRGNACPNWAIINGEKNITVSIHFMEDNKLDCGRVISQERMAVTENTYIEDVYGWMEKKIPELFLKSLSILERDPSYTLKYADSNAAESSRCYPRGPEDGRIEWRQSAVYIHRLIRASGRPFAGAFAFLGNERIDILRAELHEDGEKYYSVPGQVCETGKGYFIVITGKGKLKITEWKCRKNINSIRQRLG